MRYETESTNYLLVGLPDRLLAIVERLADEDGLTPALEAERLLRMLLRAIEQEEQARQPKQQEGGGADER